MTYETCPFCWHTSFNSLEECCDDCGFHRVCRICESIITDSDAITLPNPYVCADPGCQKQYWDEANIAWTDNL